ncbi:hypothetical protein Lalb_Chr17g0343561 [Lupinus albus]|uniref:Uncharacterized protein n=1 Tax=Lupinus albus TaxID=3870 RepID=A0A6A4P2U4_LUPAL|nr:hypothetical protein Lalb_Chr17g0343561 [Lupinus albus]
MEAKQKIVAMADKEQHNAGMNIYTNSETRVKNNLHSHKIHATVIPAPRKLVKRMMFEEMLQFLTRLFTNSKGNYYSNMHKTRCLRKTKHIYPFNN